MQWLLNLAEGYRRELRSGSFFLALGGAERPPDLSSWVHQLYHQSREFTRALSLRSALCRDLRYQDVFAEHAVEEADHPAQLAAWMRAHGYLDGVEPGSVPPTPGTLDAAGFFWRTAICEPPDVQVVALNLLSEGVALDFHSAVIPVLGGLGLLTGRYWKVHREVDSHHLEMGLDLCGEVAQDSPRAEVYRRTLAHGARLYGAMLSSWVGERTAPRSALSASSLSGDLATEGMRRAVGGAAATTPVE